MIQKLAKIVVPIVLMSSLLTGLGFFVHAKVTSYLESERWVTHTYDVMLNANDVRRQLNEADIEYFFYLINGNDLHMRNHTQSLALARSGHKRLVALTADNMAQQDNLSVLNERINDRSNFIDSLFAKKQLGQPCPEVGGRDCVIQRQAIAEGVDRIVSEERRLLAIRENVNQQNILHLVVMLIVTATLLCACVSFVVGIFYADLRKKESLDTFLTSIKKDKHEI